MIKDKPWITFGLKKSKFIKNHRLSKFIRLKNPSKKQEAHKRMQKSFIDFVKKKVNDFILLERNNKYL